MDIPAYFLTFRTYGTWLHGDSRGSVDRHHNTFDTPVLPRDDGLHNRRKAAMKYPAFKLDSPQRRQAVRDAVEGTCAIRGWGLLALNVRTNHVHVVVTAPEAKAEKVVADLKAWSTRALRERELAAPDRSVWADHGSMRRLKGERDIDGAIHYTLHEQGPDLDPM